MWLWKLLGLGKREKRSGQLAMTPHSLSERDPEMERIPAQHDMRADNVSQQLRAEQERLIPLKLIGYWAPAPHWSWSNGYYERQPRWPDVRRAVYPGWREDVREELLAYLRSGNHVRGYLGYSSCRFECRANDHVTGLGSAELTDGEWIWPEGLAHYVERHGVALPDEFVLSAAARCWKVPTKDQTHERAKAVDPSHWLDWSRRLPDDPPAALIPDPMAMQTVRLLVRFTGVEDASNPGEQIWGFWDDVWDGLSSDGYGQSIIGEEPGCLEMHLEGVSVDRWHIASAAVLAGLKQYGLAERAAVIRKQPNLEDWHRDQDVTVWPV